MNFPITICPNKEVANKLGSAILSCVDFRHIFKFGSLVYMEVTGIPARAGQWALYINPGEYQEIDFDTMKQIQFFRKGFYPA